LGLLLCKEFIEKHGKIWAESEAEKGSVFYITLPYQNNQEKKAVTDNAVI
jgi:signal transduction histidine kinase